MSLVTHNFVKIFVLLGIIKSINIFIFSCLLANHFFHMNSLGVGGFLRPSHNYQINAVHWSLCLINVAVVTVEFRSICSSLKQPTEECAQECLHTV